MKLRRFYDEHRNISHYIMTIPLLIFIVVSLNVLTEQPIERLDQVFVASLFFPIPIIIGLAAANIAKKNIEDDRYSEISFFLIWLLISNAMPIVNLLTGQQSRAATSVAMMPFTTAFLGNYIIMKTMDKKR